jgi:hypothetical protein
MTPADITEEICHRFAGVAVEKFNKKTVSKPVRENV